MQNFIPTDAIDTIRAIEKYGSFAKAASALDVSTAAVSYQVSRLEEYLDIPVYRREGRKSVLTPAGLHLLDHGSYILTALKQLEESAKSVATGWRTTLKIGIEATQDPSDVFSIVKRFVEQYPNQQFECHETVLAGGFEALEEQKIDLLFGAVGPIPKHKGLRWSRLGDNHMLPVISPRYRAQFKSDQQAMAEAQSIVLSDSAESAIKRNVGLTQATSSLIVDNMLLKKSAILAGLGIGHLPRHLIESELERGDLVTLDIDLPEELGRFIAWKGNQAGKAAEYFARLATDNQS